MHKEEDWEHDNDANMVGLCWNVECDWNGASHQNVGEASQHYKHCSVRIWRNYVWSVPAISLVSGWEEVLLKHFWIVIEDFNRNSVPHVWRRPNVIGVYPSEEEARGISQQSGSYFMSGPLPVSIEEKG